MFEGYEELNTQDVERMQEVIRTLLAQTFLPERKYDKKYFRTTEEAKGFMRRNSILLDLLDKRDWAQFHDSKNLALALLLEASELNELFLWKKESQAEEVNPERLKEELADVLTYSLLLAEKHHLDIFDIVLEKIRKNGEKYPVEKAKGTAKKYTEL